MGDGVTDTAPAVEFRSEQYEQVRAVFDSVGSVSHDSALAERIRAEFPRRSDDQRAALLALRDLLQIEERPERFRRILRAWAGKVTAAIRSGDFAGAGLWMRAVVENPTFPAEFALYVTETIKDLSRPDLLDDMVKALAKAGDPPSAAGLLSSWGEPLVEYLVGGMVVSEPPVNRRHLVEYLGMAARNDVRLITPRLRDPRWFIVRNVATAVGKAGRESAIPSLRAVIDHSDDRVRVEVIRALAALEPDGGIATLTQALDDPSQRVRNAAVSLLRANPADEVVAAVAAYLSSGAPELDDAMRLVQIIAERRSEVATAALARLAEKKFALGASKQVREAARAALGRRA